MKKVFSLFVATVLAMSMFAQTKTVTTVEKMWSRTVADIGSTLAESRQGAGFDGKIYVLNKANHSLVAISENAKDTLVNGNIYVRTDTVKNGTMNIVKIDSALVDEVWTYEYDTTYADRYDDVYIKFDGTAYALDDAGNFVMEGTFPNTPSHLVVRKADGSAVYDLPITGMARTDYLNATGDIFSADGGFVFLYGNSAAGILVYKIANGALVKTDTVSVAGVGGGNYVIAGNDTMQIAHHRTSENGWLKIVNGVATTIENMEGFKKTTLGGDIITLKGKEFYIYPAGSTNYNSEFSVRNMTDGALVVDKADPTKTIFFANDITKVGGSSSTACWLIASPIDESSAYIHLYNAADGVALFKLSISISAEVTVACDDAQGTVTGGGDVAVGANATVEATAKPGFEFVCWKAGEDTVSTDAKYTFPVTDNVALTAIFEAKDPVTITLAVNDSTMGSITLPEGIVMGENTVAYGTELVLTAVPIDGATFVGWFSGDLQYSKDVQITLNGKESLSLTAKFVNVLTVSYELNGGVTNANGWLSKAHMALDLQIDYNATYNSSKAWAKEENGVIYYYVNGEWQLPEAVQGLPAEAPNFIQQVTYNTSNNLVTLLHTEKWLVLMNYIDTLRVRAGNPVADEGALRADVSGFFLCSPAITDYRHTNDYAIAGTEEAFLGATKMAFDNPTEIVTEIALNAPYKEDFTFDGWYAEPDFSGEKITKLDPETNVPGGVLYAKWIEYIPTIAEIIAMPENTITKAKGVVTYVSGKNAYIQDATGGMLLFAPSNFTFQKGQSVIVSGKRTVYGGAPELAEVQEVSAEAGVMPKPIAFATIAPLKEEPLKYFGQLVSFKGLTIVALDSYKNPSLTDGVDTIACYKMSVDDALFPVGTKVDVVAISGYFNGIQLVGDPAGITEVSASGKDNYSYPAYGENGEYTLTNKWIFSNVQDNFASNMPAAIDHARGMVAKDGKMYFIDNNGGGIGIMGHGQLVVVDGATGKMLAPIKITGEHLFEQEVVTDSATMTKEWKMAATLSFNDLKLDQAGHFLIAGCVSGGQRFQIYKVDIATGAATVVVDDRLYDYPDFELEGKATAWRFDAFNVYGDVDSKAIIMAADANSFYVYKWEITNGVAGAAEQIDCEPLETDESLLVKDGVLSATAFGTAPQIFPVDFNYFYVDGWNTLPMLYDMDGTLVEDFATVPTGVQVGMPGDTCVMNTGHNGLCEFQVGDEYYLVMAATNTVGSPTSAFALYKFADENKEFSEMTPMWFFPVEGMGAATNGCRTAVPSVEVDQEKAVATLYVYTNNNGYGVYEMTGVKGGDAVVNVNSDNTIKAIKRIENGNLYIIRNGVRYNAQGVVAE